MAETLIILQVVLMIVLIYFIASSNKGIKSKKVIINKENKKEMDKLKRLRGISLTIPLTEKSRPRKFEEVVGQEKGILALKAALCGPNPQHVLIYGPPGVGKTAAARLVLEEAKTNPRSPFKNGAKFVEIDATTLRFDERGIADPLIGSVHDPIYQGAGTLGIAGIPQPKPGAVTKAHGGILFIDEIGELHPIELNKLLKVLEDRKVFLDSAYYSSEDPNMPDYIKEIFDNGLPADFRLIGATTRSPEEILPAIRSRCVEIFFRNLMSDEIIEIGNAATMKFGLKIEKEAEKAMGEYCYNGREVVNLIQLAGGIALNEGRNNITLEDVEWVIENGQYTKRIETKINKEPHVGVVNGLAIYGANQGMAMQIEVSARETLEKSGTLKVCGMIEEESISNSNRRIKRKSTAIASVENVVTVLNNLYDLNCINYDIHINFPGGTPIDGPSAGIAIATAIYSAIKKIKIDNHIAMTGEIGVLGGVKPIGGVKAKIMGAKKAGANIIIIPKENWSSSLDEIKGIKIYLVESIGEVFNKVFSLNENDIRFAGDNEKIDILSASLIEDEKGTP